MLAIDLRARSAFFFDYTFSLSGFSSLDPNAHLHLIPTISQCSIKVDHLSPTGPSVDGLGISFRQGTLIVIHSSFFYAQQQCYLVLGLRDEVANDSVCLCFFFSPL